MTMQVNGTTGWTFADGSNQNTAATGFGFKNRIINGAMMIDQRNAGALVNPAADSTYYLDRWLFNGSAASKLSVGQNAGSVTPPTGFKNYLGFTSLSAYSVAAGDFFVTRQKIEGFNVADLGWGTSAAAAVTLSFQVYSSLTGTFGGSLVNGGGNRCYPFTYTISSANTWTPVSITIAGDTTGTWLTTNGIGLTVNFGLGVGSTNSGTAGAWAAAGYLSATGATSVVGTNGATFYITGVQLEKGSTATSFDYRPYGTELALCQRYYYRLKATAIGQACGVGYNNSTTITNFTTWFPVEMRTPPSALEQSGTANNYLVRHNQAEITCSAVPTFVSASYICSEYSFTVASGLTGGQGSLGRFNSTSGYLGWSAEL